MSRHRLKTRQRNRTLLLRQLLLERQDLPITEALERIGGIQNQNAPNAYIRLWSCLAGFSRDQLTAAYESGTVVQGTLMRGTIHAVSAADYHALVTAIREPFQAWARRIHRADDRDRQQVVDRVRAALGGRPLKRADYRALFADASAAVRQTMDTDAEVLRVPPSGTWDKRRADIFGLADTVMPHEDVDVQEARRQLVRRYLGGFGPAAAADIGRFCGIAPADLAPTLEKLQLRTVTDDGGETLLDLPDAPIATGDEEAPVRFLPSWDSILLVHTRRTAVLAEHHRPRLFHVHVGQSPPTFMVDGAVAGTWRWDAANARIEVNPFETLPSKVMDAVQEEAAGLAAFHR